MLEILLSAAILAGSVESGPGIYQEQYIVQVNDQQVLIEIEVDQD